jgi:threonine/homoserine/homoserine lactone efflux protein
MLTALFAGLSIGLGSGVAPGPLTGLAISTTLRSGLGSGLRIAIAPLISDSVIILLSLTLVSQLPDGAITVLGIVGALVVAAFGLEILWSAHKMRNSEVEMGSPKPTKLQRLPVVAQGAMVNFLNPAPWIFWITAGSTILIGFWRESPTQAIIFLLAFYVTLVGAKVAIVVALAASRHRMNARTYRLILTASGILLLATAIILILTHVIN